MSSTVDRGVDSELLKKFRENFQSDPKNLISQNACSRNNVNDILLSRSSSQDLQHVFNTKIPKEGKPVSNQKASGRCWMFACVNAIRQPIIKKFGLEEFEFSQNYLFFWDKIERSNYYLDVFMECAKKGEKPDGRLLSHLLQKPVDDGGQWDMLINLVEKHGLMPKACFPEAYHSEHSLGLNRILNTKLREYCWKFVSLVDDGASDASLQNEKEIMMEQIYKIVSICLGSPPETFVWEYEGKSKEEKDDSKKEDSKPEEKYKSIGPITPHDFYHQHVKDVFDMTNKVCLINDTRSQNPFNKTYTVQYLNNMSSAKDVFYVNQPIDFLKKYAAASLKNGEAVWYGCDVGKYFQRVPGFNDLQCIDYNLVFDTGLLELSKADRLIYGDSMMTHAMVLTGVHLQDDKPTKWRIENSWGDDSGKKGYLLMTDDWFTEFVYEVVIDKSHLPQETLDLLMMEPKVLPPWDPLGALAQ